MTIAEAGAAANRQDRVELLPFCDTGLNFGNYFYGQRAQAQIAEAIMIFLNRSIDQFRV